MKRARALAAALFLLTVAAAAADIGGTWKGKMEGGDGERELTFVFKNSGGSVTGTVSGLLDRALEIQDGKLDGDTVSFSVMSEWQGNPVKLVYKGKVSGDQIQFNMGTEDGAWGTELTAKKVS